MTELKPINKKLTKHFNDLANTLKEYYTIYKNEGRNLDEGDFINLTDELTKLFMADDKSFDANEFSKIIFD